MLRLRALLKAEDGVTLVELTVVMALLSMVLFTFLLTFETVQSAFNTQVDRSASNDQARAAVQEIDREVRSGNLLYDPAAESPPGQVLRVYTQTNAPTRDPGNRCVQWQITDAQQLQVRSWSVNWRTDGIVIDWRTVADHVVNRLRSIQAFALDPESNKGGRTLNVDIVVNENSISGRDVEIKTSVTGRNTEYGYPSDICNDVPPG
jgi:Flp pilus assembly pilin Flp